MISRRIVTRNPALTLGCLLLAALVSVALAAPWLYPDDPRDMVAPALLAVGADLNFPLGTDALGRDVAAGIAYGARTSLLLGALAAGCATAIGMLLGLVAGYARGWVDGLLMRLCELFQTIPHFLLALFVVAILGATLPNIVLAITLTSWPGVARLVRSQTLVLRELDFVRIAPAMNVGRLRVILTHLVPNVLPTVVTNASILAAVAILGESGLSFLGLGDPRLVSWGGMLGEGRDMIRTIPSLTLLPGAAIVLTVLGLNLLGDGLNQALDPRRRS